MTSADDYTRVYTEGGTVAHLLSPSDSPNGAADPGLCGRTAWPGYWHGTGSQDEYDKAAELRLCAPCGSALRFRTNGAVVIDAG